MLNFEKICEDCPLKDKLCPMAMAGMMYHEERNTDQTVFEIFEMFGFEREECSMKELIDEIKIV